MNMIELNTPSEIVKMIVAKIEFTRKKKKLTQKRLASKAGISYGTYRGMIDTQTISLENCISLFHVLGLYGELKTISNIEHIKSIAELREEDKKFKKGLS